MQTEMQAEFKTEIDRQRTTKRWRGNIEKESCHVMLGKEMDE